MTAALAAGTQPVAGNHPAAGGHQPVAGPVPLQAPAPAEDQVTLRARLVELFFKRCYDRDPAGVWYVGGQLCLLGEPGPGPSVYLATQWRSMVAGARRDDGRLRLHVLGVPNPTAELPLDGAGDESDLAEEGRTMVRIARALHRRGQLPGGADLLRANDVPEGVGIAIDPALRVATARALAGIWGGELSPEALLAVLDEACGPDAAQAAATVAREGYAVLAGVPAGNGAGGGTPGAGRVGGRRPVLPPVRFDPARHSLRVVVMSLRSGASGPTGETPPGTWPSPGDPAGPWPAPGEPAAGSTWPSGGDPVAAAETYRLLADPPGDLGTRLGGLLDAAQAASLRRREPVEADALVTTARAAGALGARTLSPRAALAVVPTYRLTGLRQAVIRSCAERGGPGVRFLTGAGLSSLEPEPDGAMPAGAVPPAAED
jgi:hypothetical protein